MNHFELPLRNMYVFIVSCIVLHIWSIVNNKGIEDAYIVQIEDKVARRVSEGDHERAMN